jgi:hypothetical protein
MVRCPSRDIWLTSLVRPAYRIQAKQQGEGHGLHWAKRVHLMVGLSVSAQWPSRDIWLTSLVRPVQQTHVNPDSRQADIVKTSMSIDGSNTGRLLQRVGSGMQQTLSNTST